MCGFRCAGPFAPHAPVRTCLPGAPLVEERNWEPDDPRVDRSAEVGDYSFADDREDRFNLRIVNLLPYMAERYRSWSAYQLACDYHWSRFGNRTAFEHVFPSLGPEFGGGDAAP